MIPSKFQIEVSIVLVYSTYIRSYKVCCPMFCVQLQIHRAHKLMATASAQDLVFKAARQTMNDISGAYSVITMVNQVGLFAFRDPHGIRPLVLGHRLNEDGEDEWAFASEDAALAPIGFERVRDVRPGEAILVTMDGELKTEQCVPGKLNPCIFEYIYLARPDSTINDIPVYEFQLNLGKWFFFLKRF